MKNIYIGIMIGLLSCTFAGCDDDIGPLKTELDLKRVISPLGLNAVIRNKTTVELSWSLRDDAYSYVVEFSEDSLEFNTVIRTVTVLPDALPVSETFFGDTRYSARVKGLSDEGIAESKWSAITFRTDPENIFGPVQNGDIETFTATLRWPAGSEVTHFIINPGGTERPISAAEMDAGVATIEDLSGDTDYTVVVYSGSSVRGTSVFKTLIDPDGPNTTKVYPEDDLSVVVAGAAPGQLLVLYPGDYLGYAGTVTLDKSITIQGLYPYDKPMLHVKFELTNGVQAVEMKDLDLNGDETHNDVARYVGDADYGLLTISDCDIHDFTRSFVAGNVTGALISSVIVNNVIATNIKTDGGDLIDFRNSHVLDLKVTNSTFNNCAAGRDFIRMDNGGEDNDGTYTSMVLVDHCTLFGVSNTNDRILYVRFNDHNVTFSNNIVANTNAYFINHGGQNGSTIQTPTFNRNNYHEAPYLYSVPDGASSNFKFDESGTYTTLDPGFADEAAGDFTVTDQGVIDTGVGDPRWLP